MGIFLREREGGLDFELSKFTELLSGMFKRKDAECSVAISQSST